MPPDTAPNAGQDRVTDSAACDPEIQVCPGCPHWLAQHYPNGCGWCICKVAGTAADDADQAATTAAECPRHAGEPEPCAHCAMDADDEFDKAFDAGWLPGETR